MPDELTKVMGVVFVFVLGVGMLVFAHYFNKWQDRKHNKHHK